MKIIVGLGNPGKKYELTRHNVGFMAVDALAKAWADHSHFFPLGSKNHKLYEASEWEYRPHMGPSVKILLVKPLTFMNISGDAVVHLTKATPKSFAIENDLWVIHDEMDFPFGRVKLDRSRSAAGHNGIKSIIEKIGSQNFIRFRIGVAPSDGTKKDTEQFVLERFMPEEQVMLPNILSHVTDGCRVLLEASFEVAQNAFNASKTKNSIT